MSGASTRPGKSRAGATTSTLALVNQTAILDALKAWGPMSKAQLGEVTGLSPATINRITASLMNEGLVAHHGVESSTGGRPPIVLTFVGAAHVVAAIRVGSETVSGALVDFDGHVVERLERHVLPGSRENGIMVYREIVAELEQLGLTRGTPVLAVGVSVAAIVTPSGRVTGLDPGRWTDLTLEHFEEGQSVSVVVENDANALAIGELHRGIGRQSPNFVTILLERGLGAGIVANGAVYRGANFAAGEIGYLLVEPASLGKHFDQSGDLETRLSTSTITRLAAAEGIEHNGSISAMELIALARAGDSRAKGIAARVLDDIARALGAIASILDPEVIVLGEGLDTEADFVAPSLQARLQGRIQYVPKIVTASLGDDAALLGAAEMAIRVASESAYLADSR